MIGETDNEDFLDLMKSEQPISRAAWTGHPDIVELLLKHCVDPNYRNGAGGTPLILAIQGGHLDLVHFLLVNGANPLLECVWAQLPLLHSVYRGQGEILKVLFDKLRENHPAEPKDYVQQALAAVAGHNNRNDIVRVLLARGVDINYQASRCLPLDLLPLNCAVHSRQPEIVKLFLESEPNIVDSNGERPVSTTAATNNLELLQSLVDNGLDMMKCGSAALWWGMRIANQGIVRFLLDQRALVAFQREGVSTLESVHIYGGKAIMKLLRKSRNRSTPSVDSRAGS